jgi:Ca-activated chloride channel homolog
MTNQLTESNRILENHYKLDFVAIILYISRQTPSLRAIGNILFLLIAHSSLYAQYYLTGELQNEQGEKLQNVTIVVHSTNLIYHTGIYGDFGITSSRPTDTLTFSLDSYESITTKIKAAVYLKIVLKMIPNAVKLKKNQKNHLASYIKDPKIDENYNWTVADETYSSLVENPFVQAQYSATASFSANINRASYSNIRRFLNLGSMVPPDGVRIEEMLNNFNFKYNEPTDSNMFHCSSELSACPWNDKHELLFLNISARKLDLHDVEPSNLVFLIDASGSMDLPNKLPLLKSGFRLLVKNLRNIDTVSIVTYGEVVHILLEGVSGDQKDSIVKAIEELQADGPTPGEAGLRLAYEVVRRRFIKNGNNRIILATDGDFNVGSSTENELQNLIELQRRNGIYLTCLGLGMGNYKDSKLSILAQKGNGNFYYIDNEHEAEKTLVTELTQTLYSVADNVHISVNFYIPPVIEYRLIGYDNKKIALEDSTSKLEGGEIGSGHSIIALFEIIPAADSSVNSLPVAAVKISYHLPGQTLDRYTNYTCPNNYFPFIVADTDLKKAACIGMFGMKLKESPYSSQISWKNIEDIAYGTFSENDYISKEYLELIEKATMIYSHKKIKHKKK